MILFFCDDSIPRCLPFWQWAETTGIQFFINRGKLHDMLIFDQMTLSLWQLKYYEMKWIQLELPPSSQSIRQLSWNYWFLLIKRVWVTEGFVISFRAVFKSTQSEARQPGMAAGWWMVGWCWDHAGSTAPWAFHPTPCSRMRWHCFCLLDFVL